MSHSDVKNQQEVVNQPTESNEVPSATVDVNRRNFFKHAVAGAFGAAAMMNMVPNSIRTNAWAAGSDEPEIKEVKVGFIPLTDCAPIIVAAQMGFDKK
ncbi:MAG TPA: nitrate transporter, partial [Methylophilaceae bacterium]|nr:nitrate transporter [Methylophilaceae bacterium]